VDLGRSVTAVESENTQEKADVSDKIVLSENNDVQPFWGNG
jgi:hypothetical protein